MYDSAIKLILSKKKLNLNFKEYLYDIQTTENENNYSINRKVTF